jgi:hypothetical protein
LKTGQILALLSYSPCLCHSQNKKHKLKNKLFVYEHFKKISYNQASGCAISDSCIDLFPALPCISHRLWSHWIKFLSSSAALLSIWKQNLQKWKWQNTKAAWDRYLQEKNKHCKIIKTT